MRYTYILLPEKDILEAVRQAEFQLKIYNQQTLNETLISRILNLSTEGMAALDECGTVIDINDRACKILNARREDILNRHYKNTPLNAFDQSGDLSKGNEVRRSILTLQEQMILYDIQSIRIEEVLRANVISFNSAKHIKETEQCIRMKELKSDSVAAATFSSLIGGSPAMVQAIEKARRYAQVNSTVLITAPSGCGKELFAQSIHNASMRASGPFVVINCAALPESVLESLLFGYEPGTFTGGKKEGKAGLFELAHGGTVFLDEVSEMPLNIQARFLRVLQEREVVRLGGSRNIPIDIRVLAATNRDMWKLVQSGAFREDLYHRISTLLLEIPSLSERKEDIPALAQYFIYKRSRELQLAVHGIDAAALELLSQIHFTGNVRQLNNILERAMVLASSRLVTAEDIRNALPHSFPAETQSTMHSVFSPGTPATFAASPISPGTFVSNFHTLAQTSRQTEAELIRQVLTSTGGNRAKTAAMLGISTSTLWRKMKALEIQDY